MEWIISHFLCAFQCSHIFFLPLNLTPLWGCNLIIIWKKNDLRAKQAFFGGETIICAAVVGSESRWWTTSGHRAIEVTFLNGRTVTASRCVCVCVWDMLAGGQDNLKPELIHHLLLLLLDSAPPIKPPSARPVEPDRGALRLTHTDSNTNAAQTQLGLSWPCDAAGSPRLPVWNLPHPS